VETGFYRDIPRLGEHNAEIMAEAGLSPAEIADLKAKGALGGE
jgi:crotonobetainyl-CoA:carnitine CoA-transferase CaiB-like acyl-CoA transferase